MMKIKYLRNFIFTVIVMLIGFSLSGCNNKEKDNIIDEHECIEFYQVYETEGACLENVLVSYRCIVCDEVQSYEVIKKPHDLVEETIAATCLETGAYVTYCKNCDYSYRITIPSLDHSFTTYVVDREATDNYYGMKHLECTLCGVAKKSVPYVNNGVSSHGALSVNGSSLVDENGDKFQLYGLSTHGLQWFARYVNFETFDAIHNEFGNNVIRLSMYTAEGGYCESDDAKKEYFYNLVLNGVKYATALDMYVIIDWHMVGATDVNDRNPLYYKDEAVDFFSRISYELKDYNNVLYEIMNEPCGDTTWEMCKRYANAVIPAIRENTDAIILVGNPHWSADLASVLASPLEGYDNIMYTYHFYAGSISSTNSLIKAYDAGLPIFVSEYGGMDSDGDGAISYESINNWYRVLDERNISYVAWNISNSAGSASILLQTSSSLTDFSDSALKEWGIYLKQILRKKANLPDEW